MTETLWYSPELLTWSWRCESGSDSEDQSWRDAYEIWRHAEELLNKSTNRYYLVDAVTTLKRAVDHRVRHLFEQYPFGSIPIQSKPKHRLEHLAYWGIIRPIMLRELIEVRNAVEHENTKPPLTNRCLELMEFVWYFLRSTDTMSSLIPEYFVIESDDPDLAIELKFKPLADWRVELHTWLPLKHLSNIEIKDWLAIECDSKQTADEFQEEIGHRWGQDALERHAKHPSLHVNGHIVGPEHRLREIYAAYFAVASAGFGSSLRPSAAVFPLSDS